MSKQSLSVRAIGAAFLWIVLALGFGGATILKLYDDSADRQFDDRLRAQLDLLSAAIASRDPAPADRMTEPAFSRVYSGWYWQSQRDDGTLLRSRSLWDLTLTVPETVDGVSGVSQMGPDGQMLRVLARELRIEKRIWLLVVAGDQSKLDLEFAQFRKNLIVSGVSLAAVFLAAAALLLWVAFRPLENLRRVVTDRTFEGGGQIIGDFPSEVKPLVDDLNAMLLKNERLREQSRVTAANLAHALKTPAAILRNELDKARRGAGFDITVADQAVDRIAVTAQRYLATATPGLETAPKGMVVDAVPIVRELVRAINRLYPHLEFSIEAPDKLILPIDSVDLQEIAGNLIENAGKWAKTKAVITLAGGRGPHIIVDDDGPGVPDRKRAQILNQGIRLDEAKSGSGLGLSIVAEIVDRYAGTLKLETSSLGGLRVEVLLPSIA